MRISLTSKAKTMRKLIEYVENNIGSVYICSGYVRATGNDLTSRTYPELYDALMKKGKKIHGPFYSIGKPIWDAKDRESRLEFLEKFKKNV